MKFNIKTALENFTDENGNNPLTAGTNLLTFAKTIPWQILKSVLLAILVFVLFLGLLVWLQAPTFLIIIATIVGFCGMLAMSFTGILKFITDAFFGNVRDFISSVLYPIDKVYDDFRRDERDPNMSKNAFFGKVLNEVVKPKINQTVSQVPYGNKISKRLDLLISDIMSDEKFAAQSANDDAPATNFSEPINSVVRRSAKKINTPFRFVMQWLLISWGLIFLVLLAIRFV